MIDTPGYANRTDSIESVLDLVQTNTANLSIILWPDFYESGDEIEEETIDKDCIATSKLIIWLFTNGEMMFSTRELNPDILVPLFYKYNLVQINIESIKDIISGMHIASFIKVGDKMYLIQSYFGKVGFTYTEYSSFELLLDLLKDIYLKRNPETFTRVFLVPPEKSACEFKPHISFDFYQCRVPGLTDIKTMISNGSKLIPIWV